MKSSFFRAWLLNRSSYQTRNHWLALIGIGKLLKAIFFVAMGFGVINLLHKDLADSLLHLAHALRIDPENHAVNVILAKADLITPHQLKLISLALFLYAAVDVIEGTGLILQKVWAEYLTLILTASFLPWEFFEVLRHATTLRVVLTLVNVAVVVYLGYIVRERVHERTEPLPKAGKHHSAEQVE